MIFIFLFLTSFTLCNMLWGASTSSELTQMCSFLWLSNDSLEKTDAETETPILWPSDVKNWLIGKDSDTEKDWSELAGGEKDDRGWDGWMASLTQWTWVWASSGSWRWTGKPNALQSMVSQSRTWLSDWTELNIPLCICTTTSLSICLLMEI